MESLGSRQGNHTKDWLLPQAFFGINIFNIAWQICQLRTWAALQGAPAALSGQTLAAGHSGDAYLEIGKVCIP